MFGGSIRLTEAHTTRSTYCVRGIIAHLDARDARLGLVFQAARTGKDGSVCVCVCVCCSAHIDHTTIDRINILQATMQAMTDAASQLPTDKRDYLLVDGNRLPKVHTHTHTHTALWCLEGDSDEMARRLLFLWPSTHTHKLPVPSCVGPLPVFQAHVQCACVLCLMCVGAASSCKSSGTGRLQGVLYCGSVHPRKGKLTQRALSFSAAQPLSISQPQRCATP